VLFVLDSANGELLYRRDDQPSGSVHSVAWNPNGNEFVSGGVDTIYVWDNNNGEILSYLRGHEQGHFNNIKSVAYSPDGALLASGAHDGTIHLWDTSTWKSIKKLANHRGHVEGIAWSPDSTKLASVGNDAVIRIWGLGDGQNMITDDDILDDSDFPLPVPANEPASTWNELPIMPQAIAGDEDDTGYYFTVEATVDEIQDFYQVEMAKLGWEYLGTGELEEGTLEKIYHFFQQDNEIALISIYSLDDNVSYVLLSNHM
jgi:WD40 repeat protein